MKITYHDPKTGKQGTLSYNRGKWTGDDAALIDALNGGSFGSVGSEYFPTAWHRAKAVADALKGTIKPAKPPKFETGEKAGVVYSPEGRKV